MEEKKQHANLASDFTAFLYQKGYRRDFTLNHPGTGHPGMTGKLSACLDKFLTGYRLDLKVPDKCQLVTPAPYNDDITCYFQLKFDETKGFLVRELTITDSKTHQERHYRISHNNQVPGANSIEALFPKPRPWDDIIKGKRFRP